MCEETVGCNTTDTVTQEWMEACKSLEKDEHGMYIHAANYAQMKIRTPRKEIIVTQDTGRVVPYGEWVAVAIFLATLAIAWVILITVR